MARPSIFSEQILEKARSYLLRESDSELLLTIEGLALHLGVSRSTIYEWESTHSEFSDILEVLRQKQTVSLINNGLCGKFNATMSKMMLSKHGYYEHKYPIKIVTEDEKIISISYVSPE